MPIKISVVVPTLNEETNIAKLLDRLLDQTMKPDEIIISDGGSIDKTIFIINKYIKKNNIIKIVSIDFLTFLSLLGHSFRQFRDL